MRDGDGEEGEEASERGREARWNGRAATAGDVALFVGRFGVGRNGNLASACAALRLPLNLHLRLTAPHVLPLPV